MAAIAHLGGDSAGVFAALSEVDDIALPSWAPITQWFRSVAHRRDGDLERSLEALDAIGDLSVGNMDLELARLRTRWLQGDVEHVLGRLPALQERYEQAGDRVNAAGTVLDLAAKAAWLGDPDTAAGLLAGLDPAVSAIPGPMNVTMRLIAEAAVAVGRGDEAGAAALLGDDAIAMVGRPDGWYWRDRGAAALVHVLVPETRPAWADEPLGPPHRTAVALAEALEAARAGDLGPAAALAWPAPGVVRGSLPLPWVVELVAAGHAADNSPPGELLEAIGSRLRPALRVALDTPGTSAAVAAGCARLLVDLPAEPTSRLRIRVLGPLELLRDGETVAQPELRRQRVRELLCFLVARRRVRREEVTEELWPELDDRGRNLRVTLSYLQRVLQPERGDGDPPYFVRSTGPWLTLEGPERLAVDAWELDARLDHADRAERDGAPALALAAYREALPLWRGEPFADVPYADWAEPERTRLRTRYTAAAVRAGELLLAAGAPADARRAAERAITADTIAENAYQLLARTHLAEENIGGARQAVDACRAALATLDLAPSGATVALVGA